MRQFEETTKYVVKTWDELSDKDKEKAIHMAMRDDDLSYSYSDLESDWYGEERREIIRKYSELIEDINVRWEDSGQGAIIKGDWEIELSSFPVYTCDMTDCGLGIVDVTVVGVYPDRYDGIRPESEYFEFDFEWNNDDIDFEDIENAVDECRDTRNVMVKYAEFINNAIQEYYANLDAYCEGYQSFSEFIESEFENRDVDFIFKVMPNGSEKFIAYELD